MNAQNRVLAKDSLVRVREFFLWVLMHTGVRKYRNYFRRFETADEYFGDCGYPDQGRWNLRPITNLQKFVL